MASVLVNDPELELWLNNFPNKASTVRKALREYRLRHFEGHYFTIKEIEIDINNRKMKIEKAKKEIKNLEKLLEEVKQKKAKKEKNENDKKD